MATPNIKRNAVVQHIQYINKWPILMFTIQINKL